MCFHTAQIHSVKKMEQDYKVQLSDASHRDLYDSPRYHINGFAHEQMLIIPQEKSNVLAAATWGIAPESKKPNQLKAYYKEAVKFGAGLNARAEKSFSHFLYKNSIMKKRYIIPISAFFEPHSYQQKTYPFVLKPKDANFFSLAGIYTRVGKVVTFAVFTKEASTLLAKIHNKKKRQPVLLDANQRNQWLNDNLNQQEINSILHHQFDDSLVEYHPVSQALFQPKQDSNVPEILNLVEYDELPVI